MPRKIFEPNMEREAEHWKETDNIKTVIFSLTKCYFINQNKNAMGRSCGT
jgi:hypothetical protein